MADTGIFASGSDVTKKAGAGCSASGASLAFTDVFLSQTESEINAVTRVNYSDTYASLNVDKKGILKEAVSNLAAIYAIQYDMSGYSSLAEATTMIDVLRDGYWRCIKLLEQQNVKDFVSAA